MLPFLIIYAVAGVLLCFGMIVWWRYRATTMTVTRRLAEAERWIAGVQLANETAGVAVWEWDLDRDLVRGDESLAQLLSIPFSQSPPPHLIDCLERVHPQDRGALLEKLNDARHSHDRAEAEFRIEQKDGSVRHVHLRGACIADARTRRRLMVGALWDVTDRHAREMELERFAGHLAATYATSPLAIFVTTRDTGHIVEVNDAAVAMTGYSRQMLLERSILDLGLWDEPGEPFQRFADRLHHGRVLHRISGFNRHDGARREVQVSAALIDRHGEAHVLHMVEDVTERRRQKVALRESEERFARIFEISPDPVALLSADGRVIEANPEFLRFSQYDVEALRGKTTVELGLWAEPGGSDFIAHLGAEQSGEDVECVLRKKSGELAHCQISWSEFDFAEQRYVLLIAHDITELKRHAAEVDELNASLEKMVQARTAQLQSANRELESFSYSVSHDLRAPLRHVAGFASLLRERPAVQSDEEAVRLIGVVIRAAGHMGALIDDLLLFSRVSRQQMTMQDVPLEELVRDIAQESSAVEPQRRVQWSIDPLPVVRGDRQLLRSVILNLIDNALKYTRPRHVAVIEIGSEERDGYAYVHVRDNGVGFDMQYAEKLFGVFQRLHTAEEFEGTGVGLASVERIIERHGGQVWARGKPNEGATFWFTLPLARAPDGPAADAQMDAPRGGARPMPGKNHIRAVPR